MTPEEMVARWRERANVVEEHGLDFDEEEINQRNEWNIGMWRSMANELEAEVVEE